MAREEVINTLQLMVDTYPITDPLFDIAIHEAIKLLMEIDYYNCIDKRKTLDKLNELSYYDPARFPNPDMMNGYNMCLGDSTNVVASMPPYSSTDDGGM